MSFDTIYAAGQAVQLRADWEEVKLIAMYRGCWLKYQQNRALKQALLATEGPIWFFPSAGFWGALYSGDGARDGGTGLRCPGGEGENWNGRIHEALRAKFSGNEEIHDTIYSELRNRAAAVT